MDGRLRRIQCYKIGFDDPVHWSWGATAEPSGGAR